jgi:hypothetical protein
MSPFCPFLSLLIVLGGGDGVGDRLFDLFALSAADPAAANLAVMIEKWGQEMGTSGTS